MISDLVVAVSNLRELAAALEEENSRDWPDPRILAAIAMSTQGNATAIQTIGTRINSLILDGVRNGTQIPFDFNAFLAELCKWEKKDADS